MSTSGGSPTVPVQELMTGRRGRAGNPQPQMTPDLTLAAARERASLAGPVRNDQGHPAVCALEMPGVVNSVFHRGEDLVDGRVRQAEFRAQAQLRSLAKGDDPIERPGERRGIVFQPEE